MDDIICVQPRFENGQWFKRNFWYYPETRTYSVDEYADGDHEDCDEADVPDDEEVERDWLDYYRYVAETGEDPLYEFIVTRRRTVKEVWFVAFAKTAESLPYVLRITHAGRHYSPSDSEALPLQVREYLMVKQNPGSSRMELDLSWSELVEVLGRDPGKLHRLEIETNVPVLETVVRRQLLKLARRAVKAKEKFLRRRLMPRAEG